MQWKLNEYQINLLQYDNVTTTRVTVTGFVHYSGYWGIHADAGRYHLTHLASGRRVVHAVSLRALEAVIVELNALPVAWGSHDPVYTTDTLLQITTLLDRARS